MGISDRKEREKLEMRKRIISAAMEMFIHDGFEKTSIRNIAEKIEYSPATIYLYYKDKDELLYEVQGVAFAQLLDAFMNDVEGTTPIERLEGLMRTYVNFGFKHPDLYDLMFIMRSPMRAVDDEWPNCDEAFRFLISTVEPCMELLRFSNISTAALSLWTFTHGLVSLHIRDRIMILGMDEEQTRALVNAAVDEYLQMIKK
ncbi:TetR/AcrR family transcriptional regulator [Chitinophaga rhizophila]|uniref:TetR/AcrR family transcriptional regulator n=1 Tax=Chitinophaga rhizophila TaxID=2866212 RepID=A0ABS7GK81_9BACT|nr:TetR/AcrR family transcriptional regulator [Chitinophaga rhizophila]MBW8686848.1 TetR/AcrR family transcriptional regulator [Chitinophaga rhizophila]